MLARKERVERLATHPHHGAFADARANLLQQSFHLVANNFVDGRTYQFLETLLVECHVTSSPVNTRVGPSSG